MHFLEFASMYWWQIFLILLCSYLLGSLNFSIIVVNFFNKSETGKIDIRNQGSGNAGFTNVLRSVGIKSAIFTFIGDFLKGFLSVFLTKIILMKNIKICDNFQILKCVMFAALLACTLGHLFPCFFGFRGGKGILVAWAAILPINVELFFLLITIFLVTLFITKVVSLGSIAAAGSFPVLNLFLEFSTYKSDINDIFCKNLIIILPFLTSAFVLYSHRGNFFRILAGTEKRIQLRRK